MRLFTVHYIVPPNCHTLSNTQKKKSTAFQRLNRGIQLHFLPHPLLKHASLHELSLLCIFSSYTFTVYLMPYCSDSVRRDRQTKDSATGETTCNQIQSTSGRTDVCSTPQLSLQQILRWIQHHKNKPFLGFDLKVFNLSSNNLLFCL